MSTATPPPWWEATATAPFVMQKTYCGECRPSQVPGVMDVQLAKVMESRLGKMGATAQHQVMAIRVSLPETKPEPFEINVDPTGRLDWAQFIEDAL